MLTQNCCGNILANFTENELANGIRLALSVGENDNFLCIHNIRKPHCERLARNFVLGRKKARIVFNCAFGKVNNVSNGVEIRSWLVERDMSV